MNKKQIFNAIGAVLLIATCTAAVKSSNRKGAPTSLYYTKGTGSSCYSIQSNGFYSLLFTTIGYGVQATILTMNGINSWHIYATLHCGTTHKVYFKG